MAGVLGMKFDPPMLTHSYLTDRVYVVTHGKILPHPTIEGKTIVEASRKYDVTDQFLSLVDEYNLNHLEGQ